MSRTFVSLRRRVPRGASPLSSSGARAARPPVDHGSRLRRLLGPGRLVQRAPADPSAAADRAHVEQLAKSFDTKASTYGAEDAVVDAALFEREINDAYRAVVDAEGRIDSTLSADATLRETLRKAYIGAVRVLVAKRAAGAGRSEADLYKENSGRIPMWAWPVAHHLEAGISTPIAEGATVDATTGEASFSSNGFAVTIAKDGTDSTLKSSAATRLNVTWCKAKLIFESDDANAKITSVTRKGPMCARIQTLYKPPATAAGSSAYGRGTTPADVAGGKVTPRSTTLGFHEGSHGLDLVEYLANNSPPPFPGKKGLTRTQLTAAANAQYKKFQDAAIAASARSHCVGKTIDAHAKETGLPGHQIECPAP